MNFLAVVTQLSIYHGCSTRKTFWEEKFTGKECFFLSVNTKNCGRHNVGKHKEVRGSDKYVTLDISSKFDSLDKMKITSSESKVTLEWLVKGLITSLSFKTEARSQKYKKAKYAIRNVSDNEISKIIRVFEKFEKLSNEKKRPKHEPTESYFHLARQIVKFIMRYDNLNWYDQGGFKEMTALY